MMMKKKMMMAICLRNEKMLIFSSALQARGCHLPAGGYGPDGGRYHAQRSSDGDSDASQRDRNDTKRRCKQISFERRISSIRHVGCSPFSSISSSA